ncbi:MAG: SRPBCC family protein [Jatrophihabitans sp.]|uniref:SRPBCC family protein n=1 Tax=Jatrophihabitans sp. TaxID=1932789 RepID=UPI003F7D59D4
MTGPNAAPDASGSIDIKATPERILGLLTDLDSFTEVVNETKRMRLTKGTSVTEGAVFAGTNTNGWRRWTTKCTVTDARTGRFAFDVTHTVIPIARWQYDIVATGDGCRVTESMWDRRPGWFKGPAGLATGTRDRIAANRRNIDATLARLKQRAEAS